jgi:hypothetical protein
MYLVTDSQIPLCLCCYSKFSQIQQAENENNERMINYAKDQIAFIAGIAPFGPRFPDRPIPIRISGVKLNNITISNSIVGTVNTGTIGAVDQTISALIQLGEREVADAFIKISEAVFASKKLSPDQRNEIIEIIGAVSSEAATPKENRKNIVAITLLERGLQLLTLANDISEIVHKYWPIMLSAFQ